MRWRRVRRARPAGLRVRRWAPLRRRPESKATWRSPSGPARLTTERRPSSVTARRPAEGKRRAITRTRRLVKRSLAVALVDVAAAVAPFQAPGRRCLRQPRELHGAVALVQRHHHPRAGGRPERLVADRAGARPDHVGDPRLAREGRAARGRAGHERAPVRIGSQPQRAHVDEEGRGPALVVPAPAPAQLEALRGERVAGQLGDQQLGRRRAEWRRWRRRRGRRAGRWCGRGRRRRRRSRGDRRQRDLRRGGGSAHGEGQEAEQEQKATTHSAHIIGYRCAGRSP